MSDEFLYKETINPSEEVEPMVNKSLYYVLDQNGSSYNGQILFDTSTLANSGQRLAYSEATMEVPFVLSMQGGADISANGVVNSFVLGLKNGYYQLVDSIQVDYNNTNVVQLQPFTNFYVNYKVMTSMSADDVKKWGPSIGVYPDSAGSYTFSAAAAAGGDGYSNNRDAVGVSFDDFKSLASNNLAYAASAISFSGPESTNNGFYTRRRNTTAFSGYNAVPTITTTQAATIGKNYQTNNGGAGAARIYSWYIIAQIRLKDLSDWFDKIPLVKGAFMRITVNYNSFRNTITTDAVAAAQNSPATATMVLAASGATALSGRTNPMLIGNAGFNNSAYLTASTNDGALTIACGVARNALLASPTGLPLTQCRLYVPAYTLSPTYELELIRVKPTREIRYNDIYNYNFSNVGGGHSFNQILTNGIINPKYVIVMGFANTAAGVFANNAGLPVYQSPFDSAPGTTTPMAAITQFQVQIAGQNMFMNNVQYDFDEFFNEVSQANSINGGLSTGLSSGLIGQYEWDNGYRYYVCDVSRRLPVEDNVPKSVVVQGINATDVTMDYVCFVVFERKVTIDMITGAIVPSA